MFFLRPHPVSPRWKINCKSETREKSRNQKKKPEAKSGAITITGFCYKDHFAKKIRDTQDKKDQPDRKSFLFQLRFDLRHLPLLLQKRLLRLLDMLLDDLDTLRQAIQLAGL